MCKEVNDQTVGEYPEIRKGRDIGVGTGNRSFPWVTGRRD